MNPRAGVAPRRLFGCFDVRPAVRMQHDSLGEVVAEGEVALHGGRQCGGMGRTSVVVFYVFRLAFTSGLPVAGYAAAIAYVLFLAILALSMIQFWLGNRVVHYSA